MHASVTLLRELGVLLIVLSALGTFARRLSLSPVPLYLLAGLAVGEGGLLAVPASGQYIQSSAQIGLVLLLLTLGLEFSGDEFAESLRNPETPAVLGVLVLEDFAMAIYLPVLAVVAAGGTWWQALIGVLVALGALLIALHASRRWGHRIGGALSHPESEQFMLRVLAITLIVAALAEMINISAAVGAFLVSLSLTGAYAARRDGVDRRGQLRAGTALIARGEFSIVVVGLVGSAADPRLGALVAAYVLILATAGPIITRFAEGPQRHPEVHEPLPPDIVGNSRAATERVTRRNLRPPRHASRNRRSRRTVQTAHRWIVRARKSSNGRKLVAIQLGVRAGGRRAEQSGGGRSLAR